MKKRQTQARLPYPMLDGLVGILALVMYNILLYLIHLLGVRGIVEEMQQTMGYFGMNTFLDLGFAPIQITLGLIIVFGISFFLGTGIGHIVRKRNQIRTR